VVALRGSQRSPNQTKTEKDITMKTELQKKLAKIAPSVCIKTVWSPDPDRGEYDGHDDIRPDGWDAWNADITATVILCGEEVVGKAGMGGVWQAPEDLPWITNPDISGYEAQMTEKALDNLLETVSIIKGDTRNQILDALDIIKNA
jgi:hypothetical protein